MTATHRLDPATLRRLAAGRTGCEVVEALAAAQLSKRLLLIRGVLGTWPDARAERDEVAELLAVADERDHGRTLAVLGEPMIGAWAAIAARACARSTFERQHLDHLRVIGALAAAAAGTSVALTVTPYSGAVSLPGLGALGCTEPVGLRFASAGVSVGRGRRLVPVREEPGWLGVHRLASEDHELTLDDVDPYRHGHHAPPASRLRPDDVRRWQDRFATSWRLLTTHLPNRAAELRAGLRTLVPLQASSPAAARSATLREVFGAFGLTEPRFADEFMVTLVHEFQHSKLIAVLDVETMYEATGGSRYFAPWRVDGRPLSGLLQGVYAFLGVADCWSALRRDPSYAVRAERRYAETLVQVGVALDALERSPALTPAGHAFVSGLREALDTLLADPPPTEAVRTAERSLARVRASWTRRRNG